MNACRATEGGVVGRHTGYLCLVGPAVRCGDGQRRAGRDLEDLRELKAAKDGALPSIGGQDRPADGQVPDAGDDGVLRLIGGRDRAFDGVLLPRLSAARERGGNCITSAEGASIVDGAGPGVVGHERQAVGRAHVGRDLQRVVVGVGGVRKKVRHAAEGIWLQSCA